MKNFETLQDVITTALASMRSDLGDMDGGEYHHYTDVDRQVMRDRIAAAEALQAQYADEDHRPELHLYFVRIDAEGLNHVVACPVGCHPQQRQRYLYAAQSPEEALDKSRRRGQLQSAIVSF